VESSAVLAPEISFEPVGALTAGNEGMDVIAQLVPAALASGASFVAIEHGATQAAAVAALFPSPVTVIRDLAGHDRVTVWRR
jgi:methylase of polypeptide subunit release factors